MTVKLTHTKQNTCKKVGETTPYPMTVTAYGYGSI